VKRRDFLKTGSAAALAPLAGCIDLGGQNNSDSQDNQTNHTNTMDNQSAGDRARIQGDENLEVTESSLNNSTVTVSVRNTQDTVSRVIVRITLFDNDGEQLGLQSVSSTGELAPDEVGEVSFDIGVNEGEVAEYEIDVQGGEPL
jgi:hypothetical protein